MTKPEGFLAKLKPVDGGYEDDQGLFWDDTMVALGVRVFGFCGCGQPDTALRYIRDAMRLLAKNRPIYDDWERWHREEYRPAVDALFHGDSGAEYLMWYLLDDKNLTEHGGSVPGWLTAYGEGVLADLESLALDPEPEPA